MSEFSGFKQFGCVVVGGGTERQDQLWGMRLRALAALTKGQTFFDGKDA